MAGAKGAEGWKGVRSPVAHRPPSPHGWGPGPSGSGPGWPPGRRPARSGRAPPPARWTSPGKGRVAGSLPALGKAQRRDLPVTILTRPTHEGAEGHSVVAPGTLSPLSGPLGGGGWSRGAEFCLGTFLAPSGVSVRWEDQTGVRSPEPGAVGGPTQKGPWPCSAITHHVQVRDQGYSEAFVQGPVQSSPRAAGGRLWV